MGLCHYRWNLLREDEEKKKRERDTYVLVWGDDSWMHPTEAVTERVVIGMKGMVTIPYTKEIVFEPRVLQGLLRSECAQRSDADW